MKQLISINPSNKKLIGKLDSSTPKDIKTAVENAKKSFSLWKNTDINNRLEILTSLRDALFSQKDKIAESASSEMGFNIRDEKAFDVDDGFNYFNWYLENAERFLASTTTFENDEEIHRVYYEPYGVVAVIQPWNFPFSQFVWSVIPNLIVGNTVVFKHSEKIPFTAKLLEEIVNKSELPQHVLNFIYGGGDVGEQLINKNIDLISFTGSVETGRKVYKVGAEKLIKVLLELGGSAPGIVCKDAEVNSTTHHITDIRFLNCGQVCDGLKRLIVHKNLFDDLVAELKSSVESLKVGDALDESTDIGPLADEKQLENIETQVNDAIEKGAKIVTGGKRLDHHGGYFYAPTILTNVSRDMRIWKEEVFGPVLPIMTFETYEEAIELANDTKYGLGAYVYTNKRELGEKLAHEIESGMVSINGTNYVCPFNPFGGSKSSGVGREHGEFGLRELTQVKIIVRNKS